MKKKGFNRGIPLEQITVMRFVMSVANRETAGDVYRRSALVLSI